MEIDNYFVNIKAALENWFAALDVGFKICILRARIDTEFNRVIVTVPEVSSVYGETLSRIQCGKYIPLQVVYIADGEPDPEPLAPPPPPPPQSNPEPVRVEDDPEHDIEDDDLDFMQILFATN